VKQVKEIDLGLFETVNNTEVCEEFVYLLQVI
jgi:hypothetical protein